MYDVNWELRTCDQTGKTYLWGLWLRTLFSYLFLAVLGLHCYTGFSLVVVIGVFSLVAARGPHIMVASLVAEHELGLCMVSIAAVPRLQTTGSIVVTHGFNCPTVCRIFLDQGLNACLLHWQADSLPQGSPERE